MGKMEKPIYLQRLEMMNYRNGLTPRLKQDLNKMQRGYDGEIHFLSILGTHRFKKWKILTDINLKTDVGYVQIYCLLLTGNKIYLFEIKNYAFNCTYEKNRWYFENTQPLGTNISHQVQQACLHLQWIFRNERHPPTIYPCILFVNPNYNVTIREQTEEYILNAFQIDLF